MARVDSRQVQPLRVITIRRLSLLALLLLSGHLFALSAENVLIVANTKMAGSVEVAEYCAEMRGIPTEKILKITTETTEEITREEYNKNVLPPIKKYVDENENILCICPVYGVPLKIKKTGKYKKDGYYKGQDGASVDGELALIRLGEFETNGIIQNIQYYYTKDEEIALEHKVLVTSRLDGPTAEIAKGLVEKAIIAETLGGEGQCFLDTRGIKSGNKGYYSRDQLMKTVGDVWKANDIPFYHDDEGKVVDLSTRRNSALLRLVRWFSNPQRRRSISHWRSRCPPAQFQRCNRPHCKKELGWQAAFMERYLRLRYLLRALHIGLSNGKYFLG